MNLNYPEDRLRYIETYGHAAYCKAMEAHIRKSYVAPGIRTVSSRFGTLYAVDGTDMAFSTISEAKAHQAKQ